MAVFTGSGSAASPSITFSADTNTGIFSPGADQVSIATNGSERLRINATGQVGSVSLGTATAPAYTFTGDPNTGIYSSGTDQVAVATNGTRRLFVDSSGDVGIGPSTIRAQVHIYGSGQLTANLTDAGNRGGMLRLTGGTGGVGGEGGALLFSNAQGDNANSLGYAAIKGLMTVGSANTVGDLAFSTRNATASTSLQERVRITSAGDVGIGTSSPTARLHVSGDIRASGVITVAGITSLEASVGTGSGGDVDVDISSFFLSSTVSGARLFLLTLGEASSATNTRRATFILFVRADTASIVLTTLYDSGAVGTSFTPLTISCPSAKVIRFTTGGFRNATARFLAL